MSVILKHFPKAIDLSEKTQVNGRQSITVVLLLFLFGFFWRGFFQFSFIDLIKLVLYSYHGFLSCTSTYLREPKKARKQKKGKKRFIHL